MPPTQGVALPGCLSSSVTAGGRGSAGGTRYCPFGMRMLVLRAVHSLITASCGI
jgi:hypothetical protein